MAHTAYSPFKIKLHNISKFSKRIKDYSRYLTTLSAVGYNVHVHAISVTGPHDYMSIVLFR
jgi:hypothetical protein